jgi:hypothetical protein
MLRAINLDDQHEIEIDEIDDVRPNRFLPQNFRPRIWLLRSCCHSGDSASVGWFRI